MKQRPLGTICVLVAFIQVLMVVTGMWGPSPLPATWKEGENISMLGRVYRRDIRPDYQILYLKDTEVSYQNNETIKRNTIIYDKEFEKVCVGNLVLITGSCTFFQEPRNPGNYNQKFYYDKQNIAMMAFADKVRVVQDDVWRIRESLSKLRERWHKVLIETLGEKNGGMLSAMMTGEKRDLDREWKEVYQVNGIGHLLAISGLHLSFIGLTFYHGLRKIGLSYKTAGMIGGIFLVLYAVMTGMSVSTMRAMLMFLIRIGADMCGRVYDMMTALLLSGVLILCRNPLYILDAGFLLSFGAILGILLLLPVLQSLPECRIRLLEGVYASMAVQMFLFPVTLYFFFEIPSYSVILNLVVIPLMSLILGAGLIGSVVYCMFPWFGENILRGTGIIFKLYDFLCEWCMRLPFSRLVIGKPKWQQVVICYGAMLIFLICIGKWKEKEENRKNNWKRCARVLVLTMILGISIPWRQKQESMQITMLDVGQGDGIYMRGPSGMDYFIDGGSSDVKEVGKYRVESFLKSQGVGRLDYVFLSHGDADHISGIQEMLVRQKVGIRIQNLVLPVENVWDEGLIKLAQTALENGTKVVTIGAGQELTEENLRIICLQPGTSFVEESGNAASMVLKVQYKEFDLLLTGDVEGKGEEILTQNKSVGKIDVLKVAHHGSKNSTTKEFLDLAKPKVALISAGQRNSYGHPHKETLKRLQEYGVRIYNTQEAGAVTIETDGKRMRIEEYIP